MPEQHPAGLPANDRKHRDLIAVDGPPTGEWAPVARMNQYPVMASPDRGICRGG